MTVKITLACTECKQRNYNTTKNKKNNPDRLETIGVVLLVLRGVVVALLALGAGQSDFNGHLLTPPL